MYTKCGRISEARNVFNTLPKKNVVTWNALIEGYAQYEQGDGAMNCFKQMKKEGLTPDVVTFLSLLKASPYPQWDQDEYHPQHTQHKLTFHCVSTSLHQLYCI